VPTQIHECDFVRGTGTLIIMQVQPSHLHRLYNGTTLQIAVVD